MTKILILGRNGNLGRSIAKLSHEVRRYSTFSFDKEYGDVTNYAQIKERIEEIKPDLLVNCSAYNNVDGAESKEGKIKAYLVNAIGPTNLAILCEEFDIPLVHVSTDYVFKGDYYNRSRPAPFPYDEIDGTEPLSIYGKSKLIGEQNVLQIHQKSWVFRTSGLYGEKGEGLPQKILSIISGRMAVRMADDMLYCPTYAPDLARVIIEAFEKSIPFGLYHACGKDACSPFEFAQAIHRNSSDYLEGITAVEHNTYEAICKERPARRPQDSSMSCERLERVGIVPPGGLEMLKKALN